jgi:hypothetical protein
MWLQAILVVALVGPATPHKGGNEAEHARSEPDPEAGPGGPARVIPVPEARAHECTRGGLVCIYPGGSRTARAGDQPGDRATTLVRVTKVAAHGTAPAEAEEPWEADLVASFKQKSRRGPLLLLVYDRADPDAIAQHEVTAIWDVNSESVKQLGLHVSLDPELGFHASHTYLIRVVQISGKREIVLAEGDLKLQ